MALFEFGQPTTGVIQLAYVVSDLEQAIARWAGVLRAGPFFVVDRYVGEDVRYRGQPAEMPIAVALGFSGGMQIELIQPLDDEPSIYRETLQSTGPGFHHFGVASSDIEKDLDGYLARGYEVIVQGRMRGTRNRYAYLDTKGELPGFLELIPEAAISTMFTPIYRPSVGWSGKDPVRRFGKG